MSAESTESAPSESSDTSADVEESPEQGEEPESDEAPAAEAAKPSRDKSYMSLARKNAKLKSEREAFHKEREAFQRERGSAAEEREHARQFRELLELSKTDRLAVARRIGLDYDAMTKELLDEASLDEPTKALRKEMADLKREKERRDEEDKQREAAAAQRAAREKSQATLVEIASNKDAYPYASELEPAALMRKADALVDEMRKREIPLDDVTFDDLVYGIEKRQAQKAEKWRKRLGLTPTQAAAKVAKEEPETAPAARRTLSSKDSGNAAKKPERPLTKEERRARSMAKLAQYDD